ncbi:MAG: putative restriction endonuclease [Kosmotogales bacterium]|nr:putative restriction endonuclease [Kosmotogales bacterium]
MNNSVESIVNSIVPDVNKRRLCLSLLLESINFANSCGNDKWAVYYQRDRIRLLFCRFIIFTISNNKIWLALDKESLSKSLYDQKILLNSERWERERNYYPEYKLVSSINGYYDPSENSESWPLIKKYHFSYIGRVAISPLKLSIRSQKKNSSDFLDYLRTFLKCYVPQPDYNNSIKDIEEYSKSYSNLSKTERETIVQSRIGQGKFRNDLINYWKGCAVTGCTALALLRASHIKPWRDCNNRERLDKFNGLLLTPNLDSAFDNGIISFDDEGTILISRRLSNEARIKLGINEKMSMRRVEKQHVEYLDYHRKKVFLK